MSRHCRVSLAMLLIVVLVAACGVAERGSLVTSTPTQDSRPTATTRPSSTLTATGTLTVTPSPSSTPTVTPSATPTPTHTPGPPPHVVRSYPLDGDRAVRSELPLVVVFDQAMDPASVAAGLSISPTVQGQVAWSAPDTLVFQPDVPWSSQTYELRLAGARSADGVALDPWMLRFGSGGRGVPIPVLMYHRFRELAADASEGQRLYSVSPTAFEEQMTYLVEQGWQTISPTELADYFQGQPLPSHVLMLTIDDGYQEVYTMAYPILQRTALKPVLFPIVAYVGYSAYMSWDQLRTLVADGYSVGAHSYDHVNLRELGPEDLLYQVAAPKTMLEQELGITVDAFSYPYGSYSDQIIAVLTEQGYRTAYTINPTIYQVPDEPCHISRLNVPYDMTLEEFAERLP